MFVLIVYCVCCTGMIIAWRKLKSALQTLMEPLNASKVWCEQRRMYRIRCSCSVHTATGRITMLDPNLQTMRKDFDIALPGEYSVLTADSYRDDLIWLIKNSIDINVQCKTGRLLNVYVTNSVTLRYQLKITCS